MTLIDYSKAAAEKQSQATSYRKKGDALRKAGREDEAKEAYRAGVAALSNALEMPRPEAGQLPETDTSLSSDQATVLHELVEMFGARGGLYQRLGELSQALASYKEGAILENRFALLGTYNRLNAVKCSLLTGEKRLRELEPQLQQLASHLDASLRADSKLSDSGWPWADLGDCLVLLGKPKEAHRAYASFISKAEIKSPERTLDVLRQTSAKLNETQDPEAPRLQAAIDALQGELAAL